MHFAQCGTFKPCSALQESHGAFRAGRGLILESRGVFLLHYKFIAKNTYICICTYMYMFCCFLAYLNNSVYLHAGVPWFSRRVRKRQLKSSNNYLGVVFTNWLFFLFFFGISSSQLACFQVAFSYIRTLWKELTAGERDRKHALLDCWEVVVVVVVFLPFSFFWGFYQKLHRPVLV